MAIHRFESRIQDESGLEDRLEAEAKTASQEFQVFTGFPIPKSYEPDKAVNRLKGLLEFAVELVIAGQVVIPGFPGHQVRLTCLHNSAFPKKIKDKFSSILGPPGEPGAPGSCAHCASKSQRMVILP